MRGHETVFTEGNELLRQRDTAAGERNELLRQRDLAIGVSNLQAALCCALIKKFSSCERTKARKHRPKGVISG